MVNNYKRKSNHGSWSEDDMIKAMEEAKNTSLYSASKKYGIPLGTLHRHLKKGSAVKKLGRFSPVFTAAMEREIVQYASELDNKFYGLTRESLKELAYCLAERNGISHPFRNHTAGKAWLKNFMKRNPSLSFRTPEPTSIARCSAFNKTKVGEFFDNLWSLMETYNFNVLPNDIYNMDETGVRTSSNRPPKVVSVKGKRQVGVVGSAEKGELTTVIGCCNAAGAFIPPCFIFGHRKKVNERMLDNGPVGSKGFCSDTGWINSEIFCKWMEFFVSCVRPSKDHRVLLILDNHNAHMNLPAIEMARENGVIMLSVPPHTTHKLQPLDVGVYKPFKTAFELSVDRFQKRYPGRRINQFDIPLLVKEAFEASATVKSATHAFEKCGIWPFNRNIFTDLDFAPATVHYIPQNENLETTDNIPAPGPMNNANAQNNDIPPPSLVKPSNPIGPTTMVEPLALDKPSTSAEHPTLARASSSTSLISTASTTSAGSFTISPTVIAPLPKVQRQTEAKRRRKSQKSEILTSSPFKDHLLSKENLKTTKGKMGNVKNIKRKILSERPQTSVKEVTKSTQSFFKTPFKMPSPPKDPIPENEIPCLICGDIYGNSANREIWIQCNICLNWAHKLCTDYKTGVYICDTCKEDVVRHRR